MKKNLVFLISVAAGLALMTGCSKSKSGSSPGNPVSQGGAGATAGTNGPVLLKVKWALGKRYVMDVTSSQDGELHLASSKAPIEQKTTTSSRYAVSVLKPLDDGGVRLEMEFLSYKIDSNVGGQTTMAFDSSQDPAQDRMNPAASVFRGLVGSKLQFNVDADGKVVSVEGVDQLTAQAAKNAPAQLKPMIPTMFSADQFKAYLDAGRALPNREVKPGDTWPVAFDMNLGVVGKLTLKMDCTFTAWEQHDDRNCVRIDSTGTLTSKPEPGAGQISVQIEKGKLTGQSWFDPDLGGIVELAGEQTFSAKIIAQGQNISAKFNQTTGSKLVEVTDVPK